MYYFLLRSLQVWEIITCSTYCIFFIIQFYKIFVFISHLKFHSFPTIISKQLFFQANANAVENIAGQSGLGLHFLPRSCLVNVIKTKIGDEISEEINKGATCVTIRTWVFEELNFSSEELVHLQQYFFLAKLMVLFNWNVEWWLFFQFP